MASALPPFVSVIVPVFNAERTIGDCLASIVRCDYPIERREILAVDNGSSDRSAEIIQGHPVDYLREGRRGPSSARNRGIEQSHGEILAFTDADCVVTTGWIRELVAGFDADTAAVAGEIFSYPPQTEAQRYMAKRKGRGQYSAVHSRSWPFAVTANVAFRRAVFEAIGGFDPVLVRAQDKDISRRLFDAGLRLGYRPQALVFHQHRPTAWAFFRQHVGWGFGAGMLHTKYGLRWRLGDEVVKYRELGAALGTLGAALLRRARRRGARADVYDAGYELLRRIAHRVAILKWLWWRARGGGHAWRADPVRGRGGRA